MRSHHRQGRAPDAARGRRGPQLPDDLRHHRAIRAADAIEEALVAQWSQFGRWPKGSLHEQDGLIWFETPIRALPYNGVIRTRLAGADWVARVDDLAERMAGRGVQSFWVVHPSASPAGLAQYLTARGIPQVERMHGMWLDLDEWQPTDPPAGVDYVEVADDEQLADYADLTIAYWELPDEEGDLVRELHGYWRPGRAPGVRLVAYVDGRPAGKAYVSFAGPKGVAGIYGMSVRPEMRGRGIAAGFTQKLLASARDAGCSRVVLHSTDMAVATYRRAGFRPELELSVHATTQLWSGEH